MRILLFVCLCFATVAGFAQQTINDTIVHDGLQRAYILYVPASYTGGTAVPLVLNFHGYTSNSFQQMFYGDFRDIADAEGFLLVHPMGTLDNGGQPYWNSGWGGTVDDIGFTAALIDSISAEYVINQERVYSTGMSNGGFMSYTLACELSDRIAAIASVTGSMNVNQSASCNPEHPMPVMEIHGTADATVPYIGISGSMASIASVMDHWVGFNNCDATPIVTNVPNTNTADGCTAEHHLYENGDNGVEVEHYKIIGGGHTWPGAAITIGVTNRDISASAKIWEFFNKYDINGRRAGVGIDDVATEAALSIYPNPSTDVLNLRCLGTEAVWVRVLNALGAEVIGLTLQAGQSVSVAVADWSSGVYLVETVTADGDVSITKWLKASR